METPQSSSRRLLRSPRFWIPAGVCLLAALAVPVAFVVGLVMGNMQIYDNLAQAQRSQIEPILKQSPEAFGRLKIEQASNGWVYLTGIVDTASDRDRLSGQLQTLFGSELADRMMRGVHAR